MPVLSRLSSATGFKEVSSAVKRMNSFVDRDSRVKHSVSGAVINPKNPTFGFGKVQFVPSVIRWPNFRPPVVSMVMVSMINVCGRLLACHQKVGNTVGIVLPSLILKSSVPTSINAPSNFPNSAFMSRLNPNQITRIGTVFQDIFDGFGYKFRSHIVLPHGLVRGSVVTATDAPILSQEVFL